MKEPLLLTLCAATAATTEEGESHSTEGGGNQDSSKLLRRKANVKPERPPNMMLDAELYEGIVSQPIIEHSVRETPHESESRLHFNKAAVMKR